ncbi:hypothetical protein ACVTTK_14350 [Alcaligenes nematophilus]
MQSLPTAYRALILGSSSAMTAQLAADPRCGELISLHRRSTPALDFDQPETIATAAQTLSTQGPWHLIVLATGMLSSPTGGPEKRLADLNAAHLMANFSTNAIGPALVLAHFAPLLPRHERCTRALLPQPCRRPFGALKSAARLPMRRKPCWPR